MTDYTLPDNLPDLTKDLIELRKRPTTQARFKAYPAMLQQFSDLLAVCDDADTLKQVLQLDEGYYLLAGYRQQVIEKLLDMERTPQMIRMYAMQLELFGDVDAYGEADTDVWERVGKLYDEADVLENNNNEEGKNND